jgi:hypothetical protein
MPIAWRRRRVLWSSTKCRCPPMRGHECDTRKSRRVPHAETLRSSPNCTVRDGEKGEMLGETG